MVASGDVGPSGEAIGWLGSGLRWAVHRGPGRARDERGGTVRDAWWVVACCCLMVGCATAGGEETDRSPPPEVTDHTVDDRPQVTRNYQPRVRVDIEQANFTGLETESYEGELRRKAVRCYEGALRRTGVEMEGAVVYEVLVTRNGRVAGTEVTSSRLNHDGIETCVGRRIEGLRFDLPERARAVYRMFFRVDLYLDEIVAEDPPV